MTELTDEAVTALLAHYDLPTDCDCDGDDCVKCSHYPTFQERASKQLKDAAPDLARALIASEAARKLAEERLAKAVEGLKEAIEIVHKEYVAATMEAVNSGPSHPLVKKYDAWRVRCMTAEAKSRAILKEIDNG